MNADDVAATGAAGRRDSRPARAARAGAPSRSSGSAKVMTAIPRSAELRRRASAASRPAVDRTTWSTPSRRRSVGERRPAPRRPRLANRSRSVSRRGVDPDLAAGLGIDERQLADVRAARPRADRGSRRRARGARRTAAPAARSQSRGPRKSETRTTSPPRGADAGRRTGGPSAGVTAPAASAARVSAASVASPAARAAQAGQQALAAGGRRQPPVRAIRRT